MKGPDVINIDITYLCNLRCIMCNVWQIQGNFNEEIKTSELIYFLNEMLTKYPIKTVRFVGGEPLVRCDLEAIISEISSKVFTEIVTNGTLITKKRAKKLIESRVNLISFSIDGSEKTHDFFRGEGSFKRSLSGLENIYNAKKEAESNNPTIQIRPCISKANLNEIDTIQEIAKRYETEVYLGLFLMDMTNTPKDFINETEITSARANDILKLALNNKEKNDFLQKYFSVNKNTKSLLYQNKQKLKILVKREITNQIKENYYDCNRVRKYMIIDPWGDVFPCEFLYEYKYGNIKEGAEVWNSMKRKMIREKIKNGHLNICKDCNKNMRHRGVRTVTGDFKSFTKFVFNLIK